MAELLEVQEALVIHPGDKLLVRVDPRTTRAQVDQLLDQIKQRLPEIEVAVIAAEQLAVVRGD